MLPWNPSQAHLKTSGLNFVGTMFITGVLNAVLCALGGQPTCFPSKDSGKIPGVSAPRLQKGRRAPEDSQGGDATQHQWLWWNSSCLGLPNPSVLPMALQLRATLSKRDADCWRLISCSGFFCLCSPPGSRPDTWVTTWEHTPAPQWVGKTKPSAVGEQPSSHPSQERVLSPADKYHTRKCRNLLCCLYPSQSSINHKSKGKRGRSQLAFPLCSLMCPLSLSPCQIGKHRFQRPRELFLILSSSAGNRRA